MNNNKRIELVKATRLPGTDIILDAGDKIEILRSGQKRRESTLPNHILVDYERQAQAERDSGGSVEINYRLPTVSVTLGYGEKYFF